ncbi:hypothetical protein LTR56_016832 [Elasticomyces elasticus]|nr:hypothetical protein LTR56_016832 [Elasticomyces elasticus]KAK3644525.1 hypothetical protein LTR22_015123 [Elasticomyces elasticus]KAK4921624.1 hypothetical protein LTR49_010910 [Elasticomyces elasticus]KAK5758568.1 hypothetical protein LTS12_011267 [Elasticomyces elasticus]
MFSTTSLLTTVAVVAFAGQTIAYDMPSCWNSCFTQYNVTSQGSLCSAAVGSVVQTCIAAGCAAANSTASTGQYTNWLSEYCSSPPSTTTTVSSSTTSSPVSNATTTTISSSSISLTTIIFTTTSSATTASAGPTGYTNGTTTSPTYPAGPTGGSNHTAPTVGPTAPPYTGAASSLAATGSLVAFFGLVAVAFLS